MKVRKYGRVSEYEAKLHRVMERLGVKDYGYNWDRYGGWVQFTYKGQLYRFEHSVQRAAARGIALSRGTDAFAQLVLSLEDLARMVERGIYDLQTWIVGMRQLPPPREVPDCFRALGFSEVPSGPEEVRERYRKLAKVMHPDLGGSPADFAALKAAAEQAEAYFGKG